YFEIDVSKAVGDNFSILHPGLLAQESALALSPQAVFLHLGGANGGRSLAHLQRITQVGRLSSRLRLAERLIAMNHEFRIGAAAELMQVHAETLAVGLDAERQDA